MLTPRAEFQAAELLYNDLWNRGVNSMVERINIDGREWKYVPRETLGKLHMRRLGYLEERGLFIRPEYDDAIASFNFDNAKDRDCGGVIITGQPGIGECLARVLF